MDTAVTPRAGAGRLLLAPVLAVLAIALALVAAAAPGARAADGLDSAAAALKESPVYVDPAAGQLTDRQADQLTETIEDSGEPVFVAALDPADYNESQRATLFQDLRQQVGERGVYVVALGDEWNARADRGLMSPRAVQNLVAAETNDHGSDVAAGVTGFVDQAVSGDSGTYGYGNGYGSGFGNAAGLVVLLGLIGLVTGGALLVGRGNRRRLAAQERAQLETLRPVVDEDITAFGEELDRLDFHPAAPDADDTQRADYERALDAYEKAKSVMAKARRPEEVRGVTEALEDGRFALATLDARRSGRELPERRPPCFFDPRHGPSVKDVDWAPSGGAARTVPVCAADATRLADGEKPMGREVETADGPRPYWEAGPAYGPWAYGYFGGGLLPGLLMGTMLGGMISAPGAYGYDGGWGGDGGGDLGGGFGGGDFGGGFGGGDFGGF